MKTQLDAGRRSVTGLAAVKSPRHFSRCRRLRSHAHAVHGDKRQRVVDERNFLECLGD